MCFKQSVKCRLVVDHSHGMYASYRANHVHCSQAAVKGEEWEPVEHIKDVATVSRSEPPSRPPPRQPVTRRHDTSQEIEDRV